ncbi:carboxypeptidase-like regulatory domain-containing protein [Patulibacter minatonensis]|uniref:carboxypeptidase-like regulatory domain-containing protein n=1 Tax=Patulibacter minatonensis TaxID=298163 RepID=UPI000478775C|nr:carboxypeptidase-like regulatory domain-containing protein [Patulibacter minatonensis]
MRDVPVAPPRPHGRRRRFLVTAPRMRVLLLAGLATLGLAVPASALAEPGPLAAWDGHPADTREPYPQDGMVLPTDTVVAPPTADFVPSTAGPVPQQLGWRYTAPGVAYGLLHWWATREGQAGGVTVTYLNLQTGWRYSTTTDVLGRYRLRVPDGSYDVTYADPRLPYGVAPTPGKDRPDYRGTPIWDGGLAQGTFDSVVPTPRYSCTGIDGDVVAGVDGWAPGADPAATPCPHLGTVVLGDDSATSMQFMIALSTSMREWGLTGRDPLPPSKIAETPWKTSVAAATPGVPAAKAQATPRFSSGFRASRRGVLSVRVRCPAGARCAGRVSLVARSATRSAATARTTLARGTVRPGTRTVRLRLTGAGRRATRRGAASVVLVWAPTGGVAVTAAAGRLRSAR